MLKDSDLHALELRGITPEAVESQIHRFETGFPFLRLLSAATPASGITVLDDATCQAACDRWDKYLADGGDVVKMVPASGAASRMFKALFSFVDGESDVPEAGSDVDGVIRNISKFAFYSDLNDRLRELYGLSAEELIDQKRYKEVISAIINPEGLNYGNLPKGLLKFHHYADGRDRTPLEEQLVEGIQTALAPDGTVKVHFTVSPDHRSKFLEKIEQAVPALEKKYGVKFDISLSEQKPSTDTIAVDPDNNPIRDDAGNLVFRPGGHGALIENLNDLDSTVVFIKNIDNVVPDVNRDATVKYKKIIAGYLVLVHDKIAEYLEALAAGNYDHDKLQEMLKFMREVLTIGYEPAQVADDAAAATFIRAKLDRPLRVCGMVRNEGEPGGGPYLAFNADGTSSPQILESNQIDTSVADYKAMMATATHFNPVDLVCYVRGVDGSHYDLRKHVDHSTGFISSKSLHGRALKALELPGLWNGAMSDWNTVFVEVPIATFNPVKTVNDLLRPAHQG